MPGEQYALARGLVVFFHLPPVTRNMPCLAPSPSSVYFGTAYIYLAVCRRDEERFRAGIAWPGDGALREFDILQHLPRDRDNQPSGHRTGRSEASGGPEGAVGRAPIRAG